jgi:hypothetical protein
LKICPFQKRAIAASQYALDVLGHKLGSVEYYQHVDEAVGRQPREAAQYHGAVRLSSRQSPAGPSVHIRQRDGGVDSPHEPAHLEPRGPVYAAPPTGAGRDFSGQRSFIDGSTSAQISADEAHHAKYLFPDVSEAEALRKYINGKKLLQTEGKMEKRRGDY